METSKQFLTSSTSAWLSSICKFAGYDDEWQARIEEIGKSNPRPFANWFGGKDRAYIPLQSPSEKTSEGYDQDVVSVLTHAGYKITDYVKGLCSKDVTVFPNGRDQAGTSKSTQYNIGKVLSQLKNQDLKNHQAEATKKAQEKAIPPGPEMQRFIDNEKRMTTDFWDDVIQQFVNSPMRIDSRSKTGYQVVISQNPHDIAQMSTGRDWESCMRLPIDGEEGGSNHSSVFCEVKSGGLVAYLIRDNDPQIKAPLARLLIRRFSNDKGQSFAIPEKSVYGNALPGFQEAIQEWLGQRQQDISPGKYNRQGGEYSDTFKDGPLMVAPTKPEDVKRWLSGSDPAGKYSEFIVTNHVAQYKNEMGYNDEDEEPETMKFKTRKEAEDYVNNNQYSQDDYWRKEIGGEWNEEELDEDGEPTGAWSQDPFNISEKKRDFSSSMQEAAAQKVLDNPKAYGPDAIQMLHDYLFQKDVQRFGGASVRLKDQFVKQFPNLITEDDLQGSPMSERIAVLEKMPDSDFKQQALQTILSDISHVASNLPESIPSWEEGKGVFDHRQASDFNDEVLRPLSIMKTPIPEGITQVLAKIANDWEDAAQDPEKLKKIDPHNASDFMVSQIVYTFESTKTDTPVVQKLVGRIIAKPWLPNLPVTRNSAAFKALWDAQGGGPNNHSRSVTSMTNLIKSLGDNARQFIPLLNQKLQQWQQALQVTLEQHKLDPDADKIRSGILGIENCIKALQPQKTASWINANCKFSVNK